MHCGWWILRLVRPNSLPQIAPKMSDVCTHQHSRLTKATVIGSCSAVSWATFTVTRRSLWLHLTSCLMLLDGLGIEAAFTHFAGWLWLCFEFRQSSFVIPTAKWPNTSWSFSLYSCRSWVLLGALAEEVGLHHDWKYKAALAILVSFLLLPKICARSPLDACQGCSWWIYLTALSTLAHR